MGFKANFLLMHPHNVTGTAFGETTVWEIAESMWLGKVTRIQKLTDPAMSHVPWPWQYRAGICLVSCVLGQLFQKLKAPVDPNIFAPPFLLYDTAPSDSDITLPECIDPGLLDEVYLRHKLSGDFIVKHNTTRGLPQNDLDAYLAGYGIILDHLLMWAPCDTVASWLDDAERKNTIEWQEVKKDPLSLAHTQARREYLRRLSPIDTRVLFTFG